MNVLAVETTTKVLSIAVVNEKEVISEIFINSKLNHSKTLLPSINNLLKSIEFTLDDINMYALSDGPGSFTGLRIGSSTIKAFARNGNKKIIKVPTLKAMAYNIYDTDKYIIPIIDARRSTVFTSTYKWENGVLDTKSPIACVSIDELLLKYKDENVIFLGDGVNLLNKDILPLNFNIGNTNVNLPRASSVGALAIDLMNEKEYISNYLDYEPFYFKKSQAQREYDEKNEH